MPRHESPFHAIVLPATSYEQLLHPDFQSGSDLGELITRETARAALGAPHNTGKVYDDVASQDTYPNRPHDELTGLDFDEFVTNKKLAHDAAPLGMGIGMTYGLAEFICLPMMVYTTSRDMIFGTRLRFVYDAQGNVVRIFENGEWYHGPRPR